MRSFCSLLLILALGATTQATAQQWIKTFGGPGVEFGYSIEATDDGGFVVAGGYITEFTNDYLVVRFDANGDTVWSRTYGDPAKGEQLWSLQPTRDKGWLLAGFSGQQFSGDEYASMFKLDENGNKVWEKGLDYSLSDHAHFLVERRDGGYWMGGHTDSRGDQSGDFWLSKLDNNRNLLWDSVYNIGIQEHIHSGRETSDGGTILFGHVTLSGREKFALIKTDSLGRRAWTKFFGSTPSAFDSPYYVVVTAEGNYAMFGGSVEPASQSGTMWLLIVDRNGEVILDKHYGDLGKDSFAWSGRQTSDGGFILVGSTNVRASNDYDMYVVKTDARGEVEWDETYGGAGGYDNAYSVIETSDAYIVAGTSNSPSIARGGNDDVMLVKIAKPAASVGNEAVADAGLTRTYPNPTTFGIGTTIELVTPTAVALEIYDAAGSLVRRLDAGSDVSSVRRYVWNLEDGGGARVSPGTYFYQAETPRGRMTGKIVVE